MKKLIIGLTILILAMAVVPAMEVGECTIIESGIYEGWKVCYFGTVTIDAGETTEVDLGINETDIPEIETTTAIETLEITNNGKHLGWYKNGKIVDMQ